MSSRAAKWGGQIGLMGWTPPHLSGSPPNPEPWAKGAGQPHSDLQSPRCGMNTIARGPRLPGAQGRALLPLLMASVECGFLCLGCFKRALLRWGTGMGCRFSCVPWR